MRSRVISGGPPFCAGLVAFQGHKVNGGRRPGRPEESGLKYAPRRCDGRRASNGFDRLRPVRRSLRLSANRRPKLAEKVRVAPTWREEFVQIATAKTMP